VNLFACQHVKRFIVFFLKSKPSRLLTDKKLSILALPALLSQTSSVNLKAKIQQELDGLGILEKCVAITTDNANDIKSATKDLSPNCIRFSCAAHNINLVIKNGLKLHKKHINV
jgi:hypothetical protein